MRMRRFMASFLKDTKPAQGSMPPCVARLKIVEIEKQKTKEKGYRMYMALFAVLEPKELKGSQIREWFVIGTEDDPLAKKEETWDRQEGGPGRLKRLFLKAEVQEDPDDTGSNIEGTCDNAVDCEVIASILAKKTSDDGPQKIGSFFNENDDDCPEIGIVEDDGKGERGKGAAAAGKKARGKAKDEEEDEEEEEEKPGKKGKKKDEEEEEEEEEPKPKSRKKGKKPDDEDKD
jgi:hypothetical protein